MVQSLGAGPGEHRVLHGAANRGVPVSITNLRVEGEKPLALFFCPKIVHVVEKSIKIFNTPLPLFKRIIIDDAR